MKKITLIAIASIIINAGLAFYCVSLLKTQPTTKESSTAFSIAIFEPASHPALDEIAAGFMHTMQKNGVANYTFKRFNANGNKSLMRSQAEEILQSNFDLIFTIGAGCSATIKELSTKKEITTPVVFSAVDDPVGMQLITSLESSGNHLTGVIEQPNYSPQLHLLKTIKPTAKNILLVYDPTHGTGLEKDKQELLALCAKNNMTLTAVEVFSAGEIQQKVEALLKDCDVVLILKDNTVVSAIDGLIRLCNRYGKTLYASDLNSGTKGAALAYGVTEKEFGIAGARKALLVLEEHREPSSIATTPVSNYRFTINSQTIAKQGLNLDAGMLLMLSLVTILPEHKEA